MSTGTGYRAGPSRCFYEWQKFIDCYTSQGTTDAKQCILFAEDYTECLHHGKELARSARIAAEYERKAAKGEEVPAIKVVGQLRGTLKGTLDDLGLIN